MELSEYDFSLVHKPGTAMTRADALSRRDDHDQGEEDNKDVVFIKEEWLIRGLVRTAFEDTLESWKKEHAGYDGESLGLSLEDGLWRKGSRVFVLEKD